MNIIKTRKIWLGISSILIVASVIMIWLFPLKPAIDFTGGSLLELKYTNEKKLDKLEISQITTELELENSLVTPVGESGVLVRTKPINQDKKDEIIKKINEKIGESGGVVQERFETIGPSVSANLVRKAIMSVIAASIAIILYIAYAFRNVSLQNLSWIFGVSAVLALIHDLIITVGAFSIFGKLLGWEVDSLFITALLTAMGFSVHDTIVVFDRIRENTHRHDGDDFENIVNISIVQTIARSINTSLTLLIPLSVLLIIGSKSLQPFVFILFIGTFIGTYSSIFIASPIVLIWQNWRTHKK